MKNSPPKGVSISKSCFRLQQEETTTPTVSSKLEEDRSDRETKATLTALDEIVRHRCEKLLKARMGSDSFAEFLKCPQPDLDDRTGHDLICNSPTLLLERLEAMEGEEIETI